MRFQSVTIVGLGYVGLPTAAVIASQGQGVVGVDPKEQLVREINLQAISSPEPGLADCVNLSVQRGLLKAQSKPSESDVFVICVPTPVLNDRQPDVSHIRSSAEAIAPHLEQGNLVVLESTSPVGTTEELARWLSDLRPDLIFPQPGTEQCDVNVAYCPERVLPGNMLEELVSNPRIIGGLTLKCADAARLFYEIFVNAECSMTDVRSAEMAKLAENAFRDVNIAFANELSLICDDLEIDPWSLIEMVNKHPRVNVLQPGPGVGGHCVAVDPWFIVAKSPNLSSLIQTARNVNDAKPGHVLNKVKHAVSDFERERKRPPRVGCYGLAFKPDVDDLRHSPALQIGKHLSQHISNKLVVVEPHIGQLPACLSNAELMSPHEAQAVCDIHVLLVAHTVFEGLEWEDGHSGQVIDSCGLQHKSN